MPQNSHALLEKIRGYKPESNVGTIEEFIGSTLYWDFRNEIVARIEDMRDFNEENESKQYLETRGGIKALRMVISIFEDMLINRQSDLEESHGS
jgi:hypothetical protein